MSRCGSDSTSLRPVLSQCEVARLVVTGLTCRGHLCQSERHNVTGRSLANRQSRALRVRSCWAASVNLRGGEMPCPVQVPGGARG